MSHDTLICSLSRDWALPVCRSWARSWGGQTRPWPPKAHKVVRDQASEQEVLRVGSAWVGNGVVGQRGKRLGKTPRDLKGSGGSQMERWEREYFQPSVQLLCKSFKSRDSREDVRN